MLITIVTLYDSGQALTFVGALEGTVPPDRRREIAASFRAIWPENGEDTAKGAPDDARWLYFVETGTVPSSGDVELLNALSD